MCRPLLHRIKLGLEFAPAADRYRMTELAVQDYPYFDVSDVELKRSGISYTYDTVLELKKGSIREDYFSIKGRLSRKNVC